MPKVRCASCKQYVDRDDAIRTGVQSFCKACGPVSAYVKRSSPKRSKKKDTPDELRRRVMELDGNRCRFCGGGRLLHVHHVVYRSQQGPHEQSNLVTLCLSCHDEVHSDKKRYQSLCLGLIWLRSVYGDKQMLIPRLERILHDEEEGSKDDLRRSVRCG
jgi:hypothetical protein